MNAKHFLGWFERQLCTLIPMGSLIGQCILPTEKIPIKSSKKSDIREWLTNHRITYDDSDLKVDLMKKIKDAKPTKQFETDVIADKFHRKWWLPIQSSIQLSWRGPW